MYSRNIFPTIKLENYCDSYLQTCNICGGNNEKIKYKAEIFGEFIYICYKESCIENYNKKKSLINKTCLYCNNKQNNTVAIYYNKNLCCDYLTYIYDKDFGHGYIHKYLNLKNNCNDNICDLLSCWNLFTQKYFCDICENIECVISNPCFIYYNNKSKNKMLLNEYLEKYEKYYISNWETPIVKYYCFKCINDILNEKEISEITKRKNKWNKLSDFDISITEKIKQKNIRFRCNKCGKIWNISKSNINIDHMVNLCDDCYNCHN